MDKKHIVICYSGGIDSFAMNVIAKKICNTTITKVYFDIGHSYNEKEIITLPDDVEIRKVDWLSSNYTPISKGNSNSGNIIIPGRNAVFATLAASIYSPDEIWIGALLGENHAGSTDKNNRFLTYINEMLLYVHSPFKTIPQVKFPLIDAGFNKLTMTAFLIQSGILPKEIIATSSCLNGETKNPCGKCVVCARRRGIFNQLGFSEKYEIEPFEEQSLFPMYIEMLHGESENYKCHYDHHRRSEIVPALIAYHKCSSIAKLIIKLKNYDSTN